MANTMGDTIKVRFATTPDGPSTATFVKVSRGEIKITRVLPGGSEVKTCRLLDEAVLIEDGVTDECDIAYRHISLPFVCIRWWDGTRVVLGSQSSAAVTQLRMALWPHAFPLHFDEVIEFAQAASGLSLLNRVTVHGRSHSLAVQKLNIGHVIPTIIYPMVHITSLASIMTPVVSGTAVALSLVDGRQRVLGFYDAVRVGQLRRAIWPESGSGSAAAAAVAVARVASAGETGSGEDKTEDKEGKGKPKGHQNFEIRAQKERMLERLKEWGAIGKLTVRCSLDTITEAYWDKLKMLAPTSEELPEAKAKPSVASAAGAPAMKERPTPKAAVDVVTGAIPLHTGVKAAAPSKPKPKPKPKVAVQAKAAAPSTGDTVAAPSIGDTAVKAKAPVAMVTPEGTALPDVIAATPPVRKSAKSKTPTPTPTPTPTSTTEASSDEEETAVICAVGAVGAMGAVGATSATKTPALAIGAPKVVAGREAIRRQIWLRDMGRVFEGVCPARGCTNDVTVWNFHAAHDLATVLGGKFVASNLGVRCSECNLGMGTYTLAQWDTIIG